MIEHSILQRAGQFRMTGEWKQAAEEMVAFVGLEPEDFENPSRSLAKIRNKLARLDPETAIIFFMQLTTFLVNDKKQEWVAAVHELDAGLKPGDYSDPEKISNILRFRTWKYPSSLKTLYISRLANTLGLVDRHRDALVVLEFLFGLKGADYKDSAKLDRVLRSYDVSHDFQPMAIYLLAGNLGQSGRLVESVAVLEAALGLSAADYGDFKILRSKIDRASGKFLGNLGFNPYISLLCKSLRDLDRFADSASLYEAGLGLESASYGDTSLLAAKLRDSWGSLPPEMVAYSVVDFLAVLYCSWQYQKCLAVLEVDLGVDLRRVNAEDFVARLKFRCEDLPEEVARVYEGSAFQILATAGNASEVIRALEVDANLTAADWKNIRFLVEYLKKRLNGLSAFSRITHIGFIMSALMDAERKKQAATLIDAYLRYAFPLRDEKPDASVMASICGLYEHWLEWWGQDSTREPLKACRELVPVMRRVIADQGVELVDREKFIQGVSDLRRRIIATGLYWVKEQTDQSAGNELCREVLFWDLELAQRLIVERFLLTDLQVSPAGEPIPAGSWPLEEEIQPNRTDYLPEILDVSARIGYLESEKFSNTSSLSEDASSQPQAARFKNSMRQGLDESALARSLGDRGLLLRATFDSEGRLIWGALRSDESRLELERFGTGSPGDLQRLRWAAALHDFSMGLLFWLEEVWKLRLRNRIGNALLAALEDLMASTNPSERLEEVMKKMSEELEPRVAARALHIFRLLTWPLSDEKDDPAAISALRAAGRFVAESLRQRPTRSALDSVTTSFLRDVTDIWDLSRLGTILTSNTDLVFQGDDAFHAVPLAWLPLNGSPLHRRVCTVRASLAPQLDAILEDFADEDTVQSDVRRLLSVSFFSSKDEAGKEARWLHHGHRKLAERFGAVSFAGANGSTGTVGSIRATLEQQGSFAIATICGHGDHEKAGIILGDEDGDPVLWHGQGCDLSGIDWLLLASCSIGRVSRTGDLDVEGFCVQLAIYRVDAHTIPKAVFHIPPSEILGILRRSPDCFVGGAI